MVLVTGVAGFIGFHVASRLLSEGMSVIGVDNLNSYYDVNLKNVRLERLKRHDNFKFIYGDISDSGFVSRLFIDYAFDYVVNLAAQAGVRYSLEHPMSYIENNVQGFLNILEGCRNAGVKHLVFASSSSVYGANKEIPFSVHQNVDHPISLYAASKRANELMAHTYSALFHIPSTGLRFFTVYGPFGRPDMALFIFTKSILEGRPIDIFNNGKMLRDFTYVDDIVEGVVRIIPKPPLANPNWDAYCPDPATSFAPYRLFNIGNNNSVPLLHFIEQIENKLGKKAIKNFLPLQPGDVPETKADVQALEAVTGFRPRTEIKEGIEKFIDWYLDYYKIEL